MTRHIAPSATFIKSAMFGTREIGQSIETGQDIGRLILLFDINLGRQAPTFTRNHKENCLERKLHENTMTV